MKILLVAGKLTYSNHARYTLALIRGLIKRGHSIEVAALGGPLFPSIRQLGVEAYSVKFNYFSFRRLVHFLQEFDPDLVHATGGAVALQTGTRLSRAIGSPLIHTLHSWLPEDRFEQLPQQLRGIIVVNEDLREHLVNDQNIPKSKIKVIPYGVAPAHRRSRIPDETGGRIWVVGTIGRLEPGRRHDEFLRAARLVRDRRDDVHFMVAGEGPGEGALRKLVKELKLEDAVTFVQPQRETLDIYGVLDILVIVSDWGGVGFNLLEGMARGCPVIATGGGEVLSLLGEERICVLVESGNTHQLAEAISGLLEDPASRRELGENARDHVLRAYPLDDQIVRVEDYYVQVMASSGV